MRFTNEMKAAILSRIAAGNMVGAADLCRRFSAMFPVSTKRSTNHVALAELAMVIDRAHSSNPLVLWNIFAKDGNGKLPFVAFSALSGRAFCPGSGDCVNWCYTSYRYPMVFGRLIQNTLLLATVPGRAIIAETLAGLKVRRRRDFDLRLYVDGDHTSETVLRFWMDLVAANPTVRFYGYSKSFAEFLALESKGYTWPSNYVLNISSGHRHTAETVEKVSALPVVRGKFIAVGSKYEFADMLPGTKTYRDAVRAAYYAEHGDDAATPFVCPSTCGDCTPKGHACGSMRFKNVPVIIGTH